MVYAKRLISTTLLGVVAGIACWQGGQSVGIVYTPGLIAGTIANRAFIGFAIGVSTLPLHHLAHGALLGVLGSLPMALMSPNLQGAVMFTAYGALWGLLIEIITTKVVKAPMRQ